MLPKMKLTSTNPVKANDKVNNAVGTEEKPALGSSEKKKNKGGRPSFNPTGEQRAIVKSLAMVGLNREYIAQAIEIDADTLRKHFPSELRDARAHLLAKAGATLMMGMNAAKEETRISTAQYILDRQGKEFGWTTKMDLEFRREVFAGLDFGRLSDEDLDQLRRLMLKAGAEMRPCDTPVSEVIALKKKKLPDSSR